jgi:hypothetical protein
MEKPGFTSNTTFPKADGSEFWAAVRFNMDWERPKLIPRSLEYGRIVFGNRNLPIPAERVTKTMWIVIPYEFGFELEDQLQDLSIWICHLEGTKYSISMDSYAFPPLFKPMQANHSRVSRL